MHVYDVSLLLFCLQRYCKDNMQLVRMAHVLAFAACRCCIMCELGINALLHTKLT